MWGGLAALLLSLLPVPPLLAVPLEVLHRGILATLGFFARFPPLRAAWRPVYWMPVAAAFAALLFVRPRAQPRRRAAGPGVNYDSPAEIRRTLDELGLTLKKRWGQNFLVNRGVRDKILELVDARPDEAVWEIGPGLGCLTSGLLGRCRLLVAFEIDHGLLRFLQKSFAGRAGFVLEAGDAVQRWGEARARHGVPDKVVGNLPYSAASAVIGSFAEAGFSPRRMVFTVQRELAARLTAGPGGKNYSSFSALCQHAYRGAGALHRPSRVLLPRAAGQLRGGRAGAARRSGEPAGQGAVPRAGAGGFPQPAQDLVEQPAGLVLRLSAGAPAPAALAAEGIDPGCRASSWGPSAWPGWPAAWPQRSFSSRSTPARVLRFSSPMRHMGRR